MLQLRSPPAGVASALRHASVRSASSTCTPRAAERASRKSTRDGRERGAMSSETWGEEGGLGVGDRGQIRARRCRRVGSENNMRARSREWPYSPLSSISPHRRSEVQQQLCESGHILGQVAHIRAQHEVIVGGPLPAPAPFSLGTISITGRTRSAVGRMRIILICGSFRVLLEEDAVPQPPTRSPLEPPHFHPAGRAVAGGVSAQLQPSDVLPQKRQERRSAVGECDASLALHSPRKV
eukprot:scaffold6507_cov240-Isochrysis_galbana.AAC.3